MVSFLDLAGPDGGQRTSVWERSADSARKLGDRPGHAMVHRLDRPDTRTYTSDHLRRHTIHGSHAILGPFDEHMFEIAARRSALPAKLRAALNQAPIVLPAWDPMGSLAE